MIGKTISHYKILKKLGEGGMGVVYKAQDTSLNRLVALKFLPAHLTEDESTRKRFIVEAQAASALDHPNICNIHEINETDDGQLYICMAYYEGVSLKEIIDKGPIPFDEAIKIFSKIAQGLKTSHEKNIIHRDIKPGNIIITDKGEVKIVDFGLAKLAGEKLTESVSTKGTIAYMSPEVIRGSKADNKADLWSLGVMLYEMLTGHLPFEGEYPEPLMYAIINEEPKSLSHYLKDVPKLLQAIIDKLLIKDPYERYQQMSDVLIDLKSLIKEDRIVVIKPWPAFIQLLSRKKAYLYASLTILLAILFLIIARPYFFPERVIENSLVVLPLQSINKDSTENWILNGMTELLINSLTQIEDLTVKNSESSMKYKNTKKAYSEIASELSVRYIVNGFALRTSDILSISLNLSTVQEDEYLWAYENEGEISEILGLCGEAAKAIAGQINIKLSEEVKNRLTETREINPKSYEMYIKGMVELEKGTDISLKKGMAYLREAVKIDSTEPMAHAGLSLGFSIMAHSANPPPDANILSKAEALKALALDDNLAEAHLALAMNRIYKEWDLTGAGESYRRALEIQPNYPLALMHYGYYLLLLKGVESTIPLIQQAMELEPLSNIYPAELAEIYFCNTIGNSDKIIELANKSLELEPDYPKALYLLGAGYACKGMYQEAIEIQKKAVKLNPAEEYTLAYTYAKAGYNEEARKITTKLEDRNEVWDTWCLAVIYSALEDDEKVFYWLDEAYKRRHNYIKWLSRQIRFFSHYFDDPRYRDLEQRLIFPK
jgi:serine/threonine protein kinase/Tfp pilus assembly protein PilF